MGNILRHQVVFDDMKGQIRSAIAGGTTWDVEVITGTTFVIGALKNNSTDMFQLLIQVPHTSKLNTALADLHIHGLLQAASTADETIVLNTSYAWIKPGEALPASLTALTPYTIILGTHAVRYYNIWKICDETEIVPPTAEDYGGMLFVICTRGNGTYTGKLAILDADAHRATDRFGSVTRIADT